MVHRHKCKCKTKNLLEKKCDIGLGYGLLRYNTKSILTKQNIDKWNFIKIKNFCDVSSKNSNEKSVYIMGENACKSHD